MGVMVKRRGADLRLAAKFTKRDFQAIGQLIRTTIIERTQRGVDGQNRPFAPYSAEYAAQRLKEGLDPNVVNLQVSGAMLNAMKIDATDESVVVYY